MVQHAPSITSSAGSSITSASIWKKTVRRMPAAPLSNLLPTRSSGGGEASTSYDHSADGGAGRASESKLAPRPTKPSKPPTAKEAKLLAIKQEAERPQATTEMLVRMGFNAGLAGQAMRQAMGDPTRAVDRAVHPQHRETANWDVDCTVCRRSMANMFGCTPDLELLERFVAQGWAEEESATALATHGNNVKDTVDHLMHKAHGGEYEVSSSRLCNWCSRRRLAEYVLRVPVNKRYPAGFQFQGKDAEENELFSGVQLPYLYNRKYEREISMGGGGPGSWVTGRPDGHGATTATAPPLARPPAPVVPAPSRRAMRNAQRTADMSMGMGTGMGMGAGVGAEAGAGAGAAMAASMAVTSGAMGGFGGGGVGGGC